MKLLLVTFLIATTMFAVGKSDTSFDDFEVLFNKKYSDPAERMRRAKIFADNMDQIDALNKKAAQEKSSATFGINKFSDLTTDEFAQVYNGYKPIKLASNETMDADVAKKSALLHSKATTNVFDWSISGKMGPVKDQKSCGSCWAFTAVAIVETYNTRLGRSYTSLSEQQLVDCLRGSSCAGGYVYDALLFERTYGAQKDVDYPYTARDGRCAHNSAKVFVKPKFVYYTNTETYFAAIVQTYGPIGVGVNGNALKSYQGGIMTIRSCPSVNINHAVALVGYGTENGVSYWRFRNSWGSNWGEAGYFRTQQGNNVCGVISYSAFVVS